MADFPRTIPPALVNLPSIPTGLVNVGRTGKTHRRSELRAGFEWQEQWAALRLSDPDVQALLAFIEQYYNTLDSFTITHYLVPGSGLDPNGAGGGTPLVAGASQTGTSIDVDGFPTSTTDVVRAGDVVRFAGLDGVYRITADASSDGAGAATLSIIPTIPAGGSPADNAALTLSSVEYTVYISGYEPGQATPNNFLTGLSVTFREAL